MFIIFGWSHRTNDDRGPTLPVTCPHCNNRDYWLLRHRRTWFTLFFIPLIPYEDSWILNCPICSRGLELCGDDIEKAKIINNTAHALFTNQISQDVYTKQLEAHSIALPGKSESDECGPPPIPLYLAAPSEKSAAKEQRPEPLTIELAEVAERESQLAPLKGKSKGINIVCILLIAAISAGATYFIHPPAAVFAGLAGCVAGYLLACLIKLFMPDMCNLREHLCAIRKERERLYDDQQLIEAERMPSEDEPEEITRYI